MSDSYDVVNPINLMEAKRTTLLNLPDRDLVIYCKDNAHTPQEKLEGWDEFFRRFIRLIHNKIKSTLWDRGDKRDGFLVDEDTIWDIHAELVSKLVKKGILANCTDIDGLVPWLKAVSENQAVQWLRDNGRLRNLPKKIAEDGMVQLDEPIYDDDDNVSRGDIIRTRADIYRFERMELEIILERLDELKNSTKQTGHRDYWIMRLSILAQLPLKKEEISEFLTFCPLPDQEAITKLNEVIALTEKREKKRESKLGLSIVRQSQLRRLEAQLKDLSNDDCQKAHEMAEKLKKITGWQEKLLKAGMAIPRPTNGELAPLVGLKSEQKDYVTRIIQRTREKLALSEKEIEQLKNDRKCQLSEVMAL